jgi:hypothetical protein
MVRWQLLCLVALVPAMAAAQDIDYGSIDGFVSDGRVEARGPAPDLDERGPGIGLRVLSRVTDTLMVTAEYQRLRYDPANLDSDQYRVGAGLALPSTTGIFLNYHALELDVETRHGLSLQGRLAGRVLPELQLYGELGYLGLDGFRSYHDGFEATLGAALDLPKPWGLFVDYRAQVLQDEAERLRQQRVRLGVRFRFDC